MEGTIALGEECFDAGNNFVGNGYCLGGLGGVGINTKDPTGNYFYLQLTGITISTIFNAVAGSKSNRVKVLKLIEDSLQFPKGLLFSFSPVDKTINTTAGAVTIQKGLLINGTISAFQARI